MNYIDTDVLIHSLINQNRSLHLKVNDIIEKMIVEGTFLISWLNIQETGFVLAKLDQPSSFISTKLISLISSMPVSYGSGEFNLERPILERWKKELALQASKSDSGKMF